jgi:hypothetical protein
MLMTIRDNTNVYTALFYIANTSNNHRVWVNVTIDDIRMFLAIVIYIGLHGNLKIQDFSDLAMGTGKTIGYWFFLPWVPSRAIFAG